jgi:hypothetical protein
LPDSVDLFFTMTNDERRTEFRVRSRGPVSLTGDAGEAVTGTIYDVSISGLAVDTDSAMRIGLPVRIEGQGFTGEGVVRYCGQHNGRFRIGIILNSPPPD